MGNYDSINLNQHLQPYNSPITSGGGSVNAYEFDSKNERGAVTTSFIHDLAVTNAKIQSINFSKGTGGTLTLGGTANGNGVLNVVNEGATSLVMIDAGGIDVYGTAQVLDFKQSAAGTLWGQVGYDLATLNGVGIRSFNGIDVVLKSDEAFACIADTTLVMRTTNSAAEIDMTSGGLTDIYGGTVDIHGTFKVNGTTKTAIVPTSQGYRALYCAESPDVWFFDKGTINYPPWWKVWAKPTYEINPLFLETIEEVDHIIPTTNKMIVQVWGKRKGFGTIHMEEKTEEEFNRNTQFWSIPFQKLDGKSKE